MRDRAEGVFFVSLVTAMFVALAFLAVERDILDPPARPPDLPALALWLSEHPTDWQAASLVTERALDAPSPRRFELWRASWRLTRKLAPRRPQIATAFVRSGFFHWYELPESDRKEVLRVATPLLRDPGQFWQVHTPVWELTGDMALLRRANPGTAAALRRVRDLAAANGLFADYRELREEARRRAFDELSEEIPALAPADIVDRLPPTLDQRDLPLVRLVLDELQRRPLDSMPRFLERLEVLVTFVLRHDLQPVGGLERAATEPDWLRGSLREQLAARLAGEKLVPSTEAGTSWIGLCGADLCTSAFTTRQAAAPTTMEIALQTTQTDEVAPYVEVYLDDALVAEAAVIESATLRAPLDAGTHRVELRLVNPRTRNLVRRRLRIL